MIEHHGDSVLRLAGYGPVRSWKALQAEVIQPAQLPDGLIEAEIGDEGRRRLFVVEVSTFPEERVGRQVTRDALLVYLDRDELPEVITLVLKDRGKQIVPRKMEARSPSGNTTLELKWTVLEMWTIPAEELLATEDPGLMPWVALCDHAGSTEELLHRSVAVIDREPSERDRRSLRAVSQILVSLRYDTSELVRIFGGHGKMIESPLLQELEQEFTAKGRAEDILRVLDFRFGAPSEATARALHAIPSPERLSDLLTAALSARDLQAFEDNLFAR